MNTEQSQVVEPPLWTAVMRVKALPSNKEYSDMEAFVMGITPAASIERALQKFKADLAIWKFELTNTEEIEEFSLRKNRFAVDPDATAMAYVARDLNRPVFGHFFEWEKD